MTHFSPLFVLGALGVFSVVAGNAVAGADTSQWKCETCPFDKAGVSASIDIGAGAVSGASAKFGDHTGLQKSGGHLVAVGSLRYRAQTGLFVDLAATELGLDVRALAAELGQEGRYTLRLGYTEMPHHLSEGAMSPFLGTGGAVLALPAGFPAVDTAAMPLASTLQPVAIGFKRRHFDAGLSWLLGAGFSARVALRHDERDGTQRGAGSFFSSSAQFVLPLDQVTDQLEISGQYDSPRLQATLGYHGSLFRNGHDALTWANPFTPVVAGGNMGQLALAPANQFHQLMASAAYQFSPRMRASADIAYGRMTQDAAYLAATLNPTLAAALPALPAASLDGRVDTFNASIRLSAEPLDHLRLHASYARDVRDNRSASLSYPAVSTDIFLSPTARVNPAFSLAQDRFKLGADLRGPGSLRASLGLELDARHRTMQETVDTRETTAWARLTAQPNDGVSLALKLAHAQRNHSTYGVATWVSPPENPLLRKFNQAARRRDTAGLRTDITLSERLTVGLNADYANDDYRESAIGLTAARSMNLGADLAFALSDQTQLTLFAQSEQIRSRQAGSQAFAQADWWARNADQVDFVGLGLKHSALKGKLELGADVSVARSRSQVVVDIIAASPAFPTATTAQDSLKLHATYQLQSNVSLLGSLWHERYAARDWRLDGVAPNTVPNLLALGEQAPRYRVNVVRVALRYRF